MSELADQIGTVIAARRGRLPDVRAEIGKWRRMDEAMVALSLAVERLQECAATPPQVSADLGRLRITEVRPSVTATIESLQWVESRIARSTVCIGVSGAGRTGKSTLLQSLSGLTDAWVPTGQRAPVTAVPCRVVHSPERDRAVLDLHTFDTFRAVHLQPRHVAAGLGDAPTDVETFRTTSYPSPDEVDQTSGQSAQLVQLKQIQEALWSYEALLNRRGRAMELTGDQLDRLRDYVAYPLDGECAETRPARRYLAVREARIEHAFPHHDAGAITVVDLPAFRDAAGAEQRQLTGLRHNLDVALLVKRVLGAEMSWSAADDSALAVLDEARGSVGRRGDFVVVVLNTTNGGGASGRRGDLSRPVDSQGGEPRELRILEVNGKDPGDVPDRLLRPVIQHLAERLPVMDADVLAGTKGNADAVRDELIGLAVEAKAVLRQVPTSSVSMEELYRRADDLYAGIATALRALSARVRDGALIGDPGFVAAVNTIYDETVEWVRDGFGVGYDRWCLGASRAAIRDGGFCFLADMELNRARREVNRRWRTLDLLLGCRLEQLWTDVAAAFTGAEALLGERSGSTALVHLARLAATATEPCPVIQAAIDELLAVRLDYRTHLHPKVRTDLDLLNFRTGDQQISALPPTDYGVTELYRIVADRTERAAFQVRTRLLDEAVLVGEILFAAVEQFTDALLTSDVAEWEIRQFARSYQRILWADAFQEVEGGDALVARVANAAEDLLAATSEVDG